MARWIDGDPKVRARMMAQHERNAKREVIAKQDAIKAEAQKWATKAAGHRAEMAAAEVGSVQYRIALRREKDAVTRANEYLDSLKKAGIDFQPVY